MKNAHLIISSFIISLVALAYGAAPQKTMPFLLEFAVETPNLFQVFRGTMGLYFAMVVLWILGGLKPSYWYVATLANLFFMSGLAVGRLVSIFVDGVPSVYFRFGFLIEVILGIWAFYNLRRYGKG